MFGTKQEQSIGDNGIAIQAGKDVNISLCQKIGLSEDEVNNIVKTSIKAIQLNHNEEIDLLKKDNQSLQLQLKEAIKDLALKSRDKDNEFRVKSENALNSMMIGDTEKAENLFLEIENYEENNINTSTNKIIEAAMHRGVLAYTRNTEAAIDAFSKVVELDSNNIAAWASLSYLFFRIGKMEDAINANKKILELANLNNDLLLLSNAYSALGQIYLYSNIKQSESMQLKSIEIKEKLKDEFGITSSYLEIANIKLSIGDFTSFKIWITKAKDLSNKINNKELIARSSAVEGIAYSKLENFSEAEKSFTFALNYFKEMDNLEGVSEVTTNLGILYKNTNRLKDALDMYKISLDIDTKLHKKRGIASDLMNMANIYIITGEYSFAMQKVNEALDIWKKINHTNEEAGAYSTLAGIFHEKRIFKKSIELYKKAIRLYERVGNKHAQSMQFFNLALVYINISKKEKALPILEKSKYYADNCGDSKLVEKINEVINEIKY